LSVQQERIRQKYPYDWGLCWKYHGFDDGVVDCYDGSDEWWGRFECFECFECLGGSSGCSRRHRSFLLSWWVFGECFVGEGVYGDSWALKPFHFYLVRPQSDYVHPLVEYKTL